MNAASGIKYGGGSRFARLGNLLWVVLVTIFLWVYADLEFTRNAEVSAVLKLSTGRNAYVLSEKEHKFTFVVRGSQSRIEQFKRDLAQVGNVIEYLPDARFARSGVPRSVPSVELLERAIMASGDLRASGVTIHGCNPETVKVWIDKAEEVKGVPVMLNYSGVVLSAPPTPVEVTVKIPKNNRARFDALLKDETNVVKTEAIDLGSYNPGKHVVSAEVNPVIGSMKIDVDPKTVEFEIEVINPVKTKKILVQIGVLTPSKWGTVGDTTWRDYSLIQSKDTNWRPTLEVSGSEKDLKPDNVWAYLVLSEADKKPVESWLEREVMISFSPDSGLKLMSPTPKVKFRLQRRGTVSDP